MVLFNKIQTLIMKLFMTIVYAACIVIPTSLFLQVIFRYFLKNPIQGIEEIATFSFKCLVIFGSAVLFKEKKYIVVDVLILKLSHRAREIIAFINNILMTAIIVVLIYSSYIALPYQKFYKSVSLGIPRSIYTLFFIISLVFMLVCSLESIILFVKQERTSG